MFPIMAIIEAVQKNQRIQNENNAQDGANHFASGLGVTDVMETANKVRGEQKDGEQKAADGDGSETDAGTESDRRLKDILGGDAPVEAFSRINSYLFKYKPEAQELYGGANGVDDKEHVGVMAQELAENPVTAAAVEEDENGFLEIDTGKLCTALAAVVADLSKRVLELESKVDGKE